MKNKYDTVIIGGGLAGISATLSAARLGINVALVQDRPVLGGNSSSEMRVPIGGACDFNPWARETGILQELYLKDRFHNPRRIWLGQATSVWDLILYTTIKKEKRIDLFLNTHVKDVFVSNKGNRIIKEITCFQLGSEKEIALKADLFIDATGDGSIAYKAGADTRMGREGKEEFNEPLAPDKPDDYTLGSSLLFHATDIGKPVRFVPLEGSPVYTTDADLHYRTHEDMEGGYWWIEVGNPPFNTIEDNDKIHEELLRQLSGVWDHIKNHGNHGAENLFIDWIGAVPAKRESRRIMGDYILSENDIKTGVAFNDSVAYGGWFIDLHTMGGILAKNEPPEPTFDGNLEETDRRQMHIYSIPFRCLYSKDFVNLMMAGRNISVTHVALGSTRLMATCSVIGQAVGTAAFLCKRYNISPREIYKSHIPEMQQLLLKQDCYIPNNVNEDPEDLARGASIVASGSATLKFEEGELGVEYDPPRQRYYTLSELNIERAQLFPVTADFIDTIELLLESQRSTVSQVEINLYTAEAIWDFSNTESIGTFKSNISPNCTSWVKFNICQPVIPNRLYWISAKSEFGIFWLYSKNAPTGTVSGSRIIKKWATQKGAYSLRISPESYPYQPGNILNGVARPEKWTNIWISNPDNPFPQTLELSFLGKITFNTIHLIFDTGLNRSHMTTPPLFKSPECIRDYAISYEENGDWKHLAKIEGNFQRRIVHHFKTISTNKLRLEIYSTNGDHSARIYEIRVYNEEIPASSKHKNK